MRKPYQEWRAGRSALVDPGFALGACLPAAMEPQPLAWVTADILFKDLREEGGVGDDVGLVVIRPDEFKRRTEMQDVAFGRFFPEKKSGQHNCAGFEGHSCHARGSAGLGPKKVDKNALGRRHVGVHKNPDGIAIPHRGDQTAGEVVFVNDLVAVETTNTVHKPVDEFIVEPSNHHAHRIPHQRVVKAGKLPCTEVASEDEHSLAGVPGIEVMLQTLVAKEAVSVFGSVFAHLAELGEKPTEIAIFRAQDGGAFRTFEPGEGNLQIAEADTAQATQQDEGRCADGRTDMARYSARKQAHQGD